MKYTPHTQDDMKHMLAQIQAGSIEELFSEIPESARVNGFLNLPESLSEPDLLRHIQQITANIHAAGENICFLGGGIYDHFIPSVVPALVGRSEFYTAYTPYQAELSQGMLQSIFEFQTMVCELLGMDVANASMYDCATALAEAALMTLDVTRRKEILIPKGLNPNYRAVLNTYLKERDCQIKEIPWAEGILDIKALESMIGKQTAAVIVQQPNFIGLSEPLKQVEKLIHCAGGLLIVSQDPIASAIIQSPGEVGADIAVAEGQSLGISMAYGGPLLGLFSCKQKYMRKMPGRLVGQTSDTNGKTSYCLTLQAREQHIRREKATSNICTNESLCALTALIYFSAMGPEGLKKVAEQSLQKAHYMKDKLLTIHGIEDPFGQPASGHFFNEFIVKVPVSPEKLITKLLDYKISGGIPLDRFYPELSDCILVSVTEKRTRKEIDLTVDVIQRILAGEGV